MIWRIRDRSTFAELRRRGSRIRQGPFIVTYLPAIDGLPPRVAYAIGRPVGDAATRNRVRRRLRSVMADQAKLGAVPGGAYLISVKPAAAALRYDELQASLVAALATVGDRS